MGDVQIEKKTSKSEKPLVKFCLISSKELFLIEMLLAMKSEFMSTTKAQRIMRRPWPTNNIATSTKYS